MDILLGLLAIVIALRYYYAIFGEGEEKAEEETGNDVVTPDDDLNFGGQRSSPECQVDNPSAPPEGDNPSAPLEEDNPSAPPEVDIPSAPPEVDIPPASPVRGAIVIYTPRIDIILPPSDTGEQGDKKYDRRAVLLKKQYRITRKEYGFSWGTEMTDLLSEYQRFYNLSESFEMEIEGGDSPGLLALTYDIVREIPEELPEEEEEASGPTSPHGKVNDIPDHEEDQSGSPDAGSINQDVDVISPEKPEEETVPEKSEGKMRKRWKRFKRLFVRHKRQQTSDEPEEEEVVEPGSIQELASKKKKNQQQTSDEPEEEEEVEPDSVQELAPKKKKNRIDSAMYRRQRRVRLWRRQRIDYSVSELANSLLQIVDFHILNTRYPREQLRGLTDHLHEISSKLDEISNLTNFPEAIQYQFEEIRRVTAEVLAAGRGLSEHEVLNEEEMSRFLVSVIDMLLRLTLLYPHIIEHPDVDRHSRADYRVCNGTVRRRCLSLLVEMQDFMIARTNNVLIEIYLEQSTVSYVYRRIRGNANEERFAGSCIICLCDLEDNDLVRRLACLHVYHKECIDQWLLTNWKCPLCRLDVREAPRNLPRHVENFATD